MRNYHMTVVMTVDKRCAASGRALQAESAASKIFNTTWENTFAENSAITNKSINKTRFAVMIFYEMFLSVWIIRHFV